MYLALIAKRLSPGTVRRAATVLHAALNDAVHRGLISHNPADNTTMPAVRKYEPTVLSEEQVLAYLEDARQTATTSIYALYTTAAGTGMRLGELLGAPEDAVDLRQRLLHVRQTLVRAGVVLIYGQPKTQRSRRAILLPEVAVEAIRAALHWKKHQRLRLGPAWRDAGLIFCGPRGRPIHLSNLHRRDHRPRLARLGLPPTRIHDLRHFHATFLIASGIDPRTSADRLGHSSASFMLKTYAHAVARAQEHAAAVANDLLTRSGRF
jgi:integrase